MSDIILRAVEAQHMVREQNFRPGDTVKAHVKIVEEKKTRIQIYQGTVIAVNGSGINKKFTVPSLLVSL